MFALRYLVKIQELLEMTAQRDLVVKAKMF